MPNNRQDVEGQIRNQFSPGWVIFDGEYSVASVIAEGIADWATAGGYEQLPVDNATSAAESLGIHLAEAMATNGFNAATDVFYGGTMTFQNWEEPIDGVRIPFPNKFVPYIACRKGGGGSGSLPPIPSYQQFSMHQATAEGETGTDSSYEFLLASNRDLFIIEKHATGSRKTEVHVLTAASNYQTFSMHQATAEGETGTDSSYEFLLASNRDLFIIEKHATGSRKTEVHVLTAASNYQTFSMHQATAEGETGTDSSYEFLLAPNRDLFIIEKHATGSHKTEVHVLAA